jgi:hypothetical protein
MYNSSYVVTLKYNSVMDKCNTVQMRNITAFYTVMGEAPSSNLPISQHSRMIQLDRQWCSLLSLSLS